jgi:hypothetical protein
VCVQLRLTPAAGAAPQQQQQADGGSSVADHGGSSSSEVAYVWLVNTHLDHAAADIRKRQAQVCCSCTWQMPAAYRCAGKHVSRVEVTVFAIIAMHSIAWMYVRSRCLIAAVLHLILMRDLHDVSCSASSASSSGSDCL